MKTLFAICTMLGVWPAMAGTAEILWYDQPAIDWKTQALPIGNGRIGGMFFGGVDRERIQFNEQSLWSGRPFMKAGKNDPADFDKVHALLKTGKFSEAEELASKLRTGYGSPGADTTTSGPENYKEYIRAFGANQAFGDLYLQNTKPAGRAMNYRRELDISRAVGSVSYQADGVTYWREYFCSHRDQVMVLRFSASQPGQIHLRASFATPHAGAATTTIAPDGKSPATLQLSGKLADNAMRFNARLAALAKGGTVRADKDALDISGADEVIFLLGAATDFKSDIYPRYTGEDPAIVSAREIEAAGRKSFDALLAAHVADYQRFYNRCTLDLSGPDLSTLPTDQRLDRYGREGDPGFEALAFQYGRYLLISSSRPGAMPAHLQGIWNDSTDPVWSADWHNDINIQMNYWPVEVTGLSECHLPMFDYMKTLLEPGREVARRSFNARGWYAAINTNPWSYADPRWMWRSGAAWLCQHVWEHYRFTRDRGFLEATGYPLMKEAALFLLDSLIEVDGKLVTGVSESPENHFYAPQDGKKCLSDFGVAIDMQLTWELFGNCVEAARILGTDAEFAKQLADARARLAPPRVGRMGQLQEWYHDFDRTDDDHRHTAHLLAVFPGCQVTPQDTPDLARAAVVSLKQRGTTFASWAYSWRSLIWSRLGDADQAYWWLNGAMGRPVSTHWRNEPVTIRCLSPNLLGAHLPYFQIDANFGLTAAVAEMLVQSHRDGIVLLPTLPKAWPSGKVTGLRARGGFTVDIEWKDGKATSWKITAAHREPVKVRVNGEVRSVTPERIGL